MTSFCHDQFEHPLLWCDDKRRTVERQEAQQSLVEVRQRKEAEKLKTIHERNEVKPYTSSFARISVITYVAYRMYKQFFSRTL